MRKAHPASGAFFLLAWFWRTRESLRTNRVGSLLSMRGMLLGYNFEPRPNTRTPATTGSVMTIGLSIKRCSHLKNPFDQRKQDWLVQKFGCGDLKGLTPFRQSLLLSSSLKKAKGRSTRRVRKNPSLSCLSWPGLPGQFWKMASAQSCNRAFSVTWPASMQIYWINHSHKKRVQLPQRGRRFIVLDHQYGRRDVIRKHY